MIKQFTVENFKSIEKLTMELGRVTVFIGANGSGKSNILEALALGSAAANNKLDNEFLASRGIRVPTDPRLMRAAFEKEHTEEEIHIRFQNDEGSDFDYLLQKDNNQPYSSWRDDSGPQAKLEALINSLQKLGADTTDLEPSQNVYDLFARAAAPQDLQRFLIYSPEYRTLRTFEEEGQIQPLGIGGEGLFRLLEVIGENDLDAFADIKTRMECIDWFDDFAIPSDLSVGERNLRLTDRYLDEGFHDLSQRNANEGFLFLLFYFCLFLSKDTPAFFAIDNIDISLNPKLCRHLIRELCDIATEESKQVIFTTHNPAVLDGLNLHDEEQRLFVVSRDILGKTRVTRVFAPKVVEGQDPVRLSEAFLRGYIGGLPRNF